MATNPTTGPPLRFRLWMSVTSMLLMAVFVGYEICRIERHGATPARLFFVLCYVGLVTFGLFELRNILRRLERGPADGAAEN